MALRIPPEKQLTELAKHYGEDPNLEAFRGTKKSGITPVDPLPPAGPALSREDWQIRKLIEAAQKKKLAGFTARELKAIGAFTYFESAMPSNISSPIHPVFGKWENSNGNIGGRHNPMIPLGKGRNGYWEITNLLVEAALEPCLRLATQFIDSSHMWTWWDTICFGELKPIVPETRKDGMLLYSVHPRDPVVVHEESQKTRDRFIELAANLTWGLGSGITDPLAGGPNFRAGEWAGITFQDPLRGSIICMLGVDRIEQLMRTDLLEAERLILQFSIARTAVHELAHAMWRLNKRWAEGLGLGVIGPEPYFDNEVTAELGHSWINHLLGGREVGITSAGYLAMERQYIASYFVPYPNWRDNIPPVLSKVKSLFQDDYFPIPIEYFGRIQQQEFWDYHVKVFGRYSVHMGPLIHGRSDKSKKNITYITPVDHHEIIMTDDAGEEDVAAVDIENEKRLNARAVWTALDLTNAAERSHDARLISELLPRDENKVQAGTFNSMIEALAEGFDLNPISWADELTDGQHIDGEPEEHNEPARFSEIAAFINSHRHELAIDTMIWAIPELTFLGYINHIGSISITREEFRAFLRHANFMEVLFRWDNSGLGMISRRLAGWDPATFPPQLRFTQPKPEHLELMENHMLENWSLYTRRLLRDIDDDLAFRYFNSRISSELTRAEHDNLINYYHHKKRWWVRGPMGIIRCIGGIPKKVLEERKRRNKEAKNKAEREKKLKEQRRAEKKEQRKQERERQNSEKNKQNREATEKMRAKMTVDWNKAMKRVREQEDEGHPEGSDRKRRKLSHEALEISAKEANRASTGKDGGEVIPSPMDLTL